MFDRKLTVDLKPILRVPIGKLIKGPPKSTEQKLSSILRQQHPPLLIAVGDVSSKIVSNLAYKHHILVFDKKIKRRAASKLITGYKNFLETRNPPGMLTAAACIAIRKAIRFGDSTAIYVSGEEDLLALPAILYGPLSSIVIYGQPNEGLVITLVTPEKKQFVNRIISMMKVSK